MSRFARSTWILTATLAATACGGEDEPGRLPRPTEPVDVVVSSVGTAGALDAFSATVVSEREADVATRVSGTVERVTVEVGTHVRAGDALVLLDRGDVEARVAGARAQESLAERTHRRVASLAGQGAASRQELDQAEAVLEGARSARVEAEAQESYAVVRAPFDGVVAERRVDAGDLATPGTPLLRLVAPGALKVVADIPASRAAALLPGVPIVVRSGDVAASTTVARAVSVIDGGARTVRVEARVDASTGFVAGGYARIEVESASAEARWVPADAVVTRGQLTGVFAVEGDSLRLRWVRLGRTRDGATELLAGPPGRLDVVRRPGAELVDGQRVRTAREETWAVGTTRASSGEVDR